MLKQVFLTIQLRFGIILFAVNALIKQGGGLPVGVFEEKIISTFGSYDKFVEELKTAGTTQFGSGWAWFVKDTDGSSRHN